MWRPGSPEHPKATQTATITFQDEKEAIDALAYNNRQVGDSRVGIDVGFLGLTLLYSSDKPEIE